MKNIAVFTSTRAEYGLLKPVIQKLNKNSDINTKLVVTGTHLSAKHGNTYKEIEKDGIKIDVKIDILLDDDSSIGISKTMSNAIEKYSRYFYNSNIDLLIILGDRYEALSAAISSIVCHIPIAHIHGGEITFAAIDDSIRHSITKMSYLHFTSTDIHKKRVIQLGENPNRVFNVGALGVENIHNIDFIKKNDLAKELNINLNNFALATFHPVTLENNTAKNQILTLLNVCKTQKGINFIFTKANADSGGKIINEIIQDYSKSTDNIYLFSSLGAIRYLSAMKYSRFVIGNSSSGIIEAPSFYIPTINIGDRQKGRQRANSVIDCDCKIQDIQQAIKKAMSNEYLKICKESQNPYYKENTSQKIVDTILYYVLNDKLKIQKEFYDIK